MSLLKLVETPPEDAIDDFEDVLDRSSLWHWFKEGDRINKQQPQEAWVLVSSLYYHNALKENIGQEFAANSLRLWLESKGCYHHFNAVACNNIVNYAIKSKHPTVSDFRQVGVQPGRKNGKLFDVPIPAPIEKEMPATLKQIDEDWGNMKAAKLGYTKIPNTIFRPDLNLRVIDQSIIIYLLSLKRISKVGYIVSASIDNVAKAVKVSKSVAVTHLNWLVDNGYLVKYPSSAGAASYDLTPTFAKLGA